MLDWFKKEKPFQGMLGLGGGVASRTIGGAAFEIGQAEFTTAGSFNWEAPASAAHFGVSVVCIGAGGAGESSLGRGKAGG